MTPLTPRQREVLDLIRLSVDRRGYPPTLAELRYDLGVSSTYTVTCHLEALSRKGYIERDAGVSRGIRVMERATMETGGEPCPST